MGRLKIKKKRRSCCGQRLAWKHHSEGVYLLVCQSCGKCHEERRVDPGKEFK